MGNKVNYEPFSPFMQNYFCIMEEYRAAFVAISKNAVTTLKNIVIYTKEGCFPEADVITHNYIGYTPESEFLVPVSEMSQYEQVHGKYLKFAVWRDPVERLVSTYKHFILQKARRAYFNYLGLYNDTTFERFLQIVEFDLQKSDPLYQDEHFRKQSDYYRPTDVDYIVPIKKLDRFLLEHDIPLLDKKSNETHVSFKLEDEEIIKVIRHWYRDDYEIMTNY